MFDLFYYLFFVLQGRFDPGFSLDSKTYWLARGCAEAGIDVHVVTNSLAVEEEYRIPSCGEDYYLPPGVHVHNIPVETPWHIPYSELFMEKLLDKTLEVCSSFDIDLIDSHYLVPHGIVACLTSAITGIPYVIRHGGSDLHKFWNQDILRVLLRKTFEGAAALVSNRRDLSSINPNLIVLPPYVPDERCFKPCRKNNNRVTFAYVGKINYYWRHKGLHHIAEFWSRLPFESDLILLAQGRGKRDFIRQCKLEGAKFSDFIPPWRMPYFLQKIDYLFYLVRENPIPDFANIVVEAVACGARIITDDPGAFNLYRPFFDPSEFVIDIKNYDQLRSIAQCRQKHPLRTRYSEYVRSNLNMYEKAR